MSTVPGGLGRAQADRASATLLTLPGWTSGRIAEAFGVRKDTMRQWRTGFRTGGVQALETRVAAGFAAVEGEAALRVAVTLLALPVADRTNWTTVRRGFNGPHSRVPFLHR
ncbi:transposase [Methylobacterium nodulans]|uniref:Putative transposase n=1 Tax=Methylobacterium nodulans (strain LMG 21967 / CNCM I-2342 / ORS 2060) TaxID=460265 RepID=B8IAB8_METNO|nr:transposase [Methylobacterium nodulans]ACL59181.1 putative transposase [Methylobacterium nodulans ORS 2060]